MRGLAFLLIFVAFVFFFSGLDDKYSIIPNTFAETNSNLYVSSENVLFENHFVGPMVIEVKISDSDIDNLLLNSKVLNTS